MEQLGRSIYIPAIRNGEQNLSEAFMLAKKRMMEWKFAYIKDVEKVSTPIIFNLLSQPIPDFDIKRVEVEASKMKEISFADGKPILVNILLRSCYKSCNFPVREGDINTISNESLLLYRISSVFNKNLKDTNDEFCIGSFSY